MESRHDLREPAGVTEHVDGPLLHYEIHGRRGPHVLLVHGFLSSRSQWMLNVEALASFARPVVVELFGHGRSPSPEDADLYRPSSYVGQFERIREAVGADRWLVVGQSLGAALTLRYALDHPERVVAHVFTNSNSALAEEHWGQRVRPAMETQARQLATGGRAVLDSHPLNPARAGRLPPEVRAAFTKDNALLDARGVANTGLFTVPDSSSRQRVPANRVPTLLVVGEREERFAAHRAFAEEAMPMLTVVGLDAGHAVNIEAADGFNTAVSEFCLAEMAKSTEAT